LEISADQSARLQIVRFLQEALLRQNHVMAVPTTVDIPEPLHDRLRRRAESAGVSIRSLIVTAIEQTYAEPRNGRPVTGPLILHNGKLGPRFATDENPNDLVLS
jgi:hypothetical protein